jgi:hypothetical protein
MTTEPEQLSNNSNSATGDQSFLHGLVDKLFTALTADVKLPRAEISPEQIAGNLQGDYQEQIAILKARVDELIAEKQQQQINQDDSSILVSANPLVASSPTPDIPIRPISTNDPKLEYMNLYRSNPRAAARYLQENWASLSVVPIFGDS